MLHIQCVIHMNEPRSLLKYSQESGDAERDGQKSQALLILNRAKGQQSHDDDAAPAHLLR